MALLAGAARVEITPEPGIELMGYGARVGLACSVHDPLFARALYLHEGPGHSALLISADLCLLASEQCLAVREELAEGTGLALGQILVACTHTHSGPETGLAALLSGREPAAHVRGLLAALVEAGRDAVRAARPARLGWSRGEVRIGRNRRLEHGPLDPQILVLRVEERSGRPLAVLFQHACHATVLGHDNLEISADWPGVACERIDRETGALALFLLGAHADIDPRTRALKDLVIPGQSVGLGHDAVGVLGLEVAHAVLAALDDARLEEHASISAQSAQVTLPLHLGDCSPEQARVELGRRKEELRELLELARFPKLSQLQQVAEGRALQLAPEQARRLLSLTRLYLRDKTAPFFVGGRRELAVEVQVLQLADTGLLALPLEPTTNVGLDWKRRARGRVAHAGVAGIANGWLRYLPHAQDFAHPQAAQHYEILQSTFTPDAAERLLQKGDQLLASAT